MNTVQVHKMRPPVTQASSLSPAAVWHPCLMYTAVNTSFCFSPSPDSAAAIHYYRQAMLLVPDIEYRVSDLITDSGR